MMPFELDLGYEPPAPVDLIADLQRPQAMDSAKTFQGREFWVLPGMSCAMVKITRRLRLISHDAQLTQPSPPV